MIPYITEKTMSLAKKGIFTLIGPESAEKISFVKKVEQLFDVNIVSIKTIRLQPKKRRRGRILGRGPIMKKILIQVKKGQKMPGFEVAKEKNKSVTNK